MNRKAPDPLEVAGIWSQPARGAEPVDPRALFCNDAPLELEIGSGRGLFLSREAARCPGVNFVGVEWSRKFSLLAAGRVSNLRLSNVRILCDDAKRLVPLFPANVFQAVHVYFPDPWWKRRHGKRRMIEPALVAQLSRVLQDGGTLRLATDVEPYFQIMLNVVGDCGDFIRMVDPVVHLPADDLDYMTHFERKYRRAGKAIYRADFRREDRR